MNGAARVLVVYKRSALSLLGGSRRVRRLLAARDPTVSRLVRSHRAHAATLERVRIALDRLGVRATFRHRREVGRTRGFDLIVTVGGDGTLLWVSHSLGDDVPVLSVNSAPGHSVGYFAGAVPANLERRIGAAVRGTLPVTRLARMRVAIDGEEVERRVLNNVLFCHRSPAATTRYFLRMKGELEEQKSSGVWVGPAAGSTAAQRSAGGRVLPASSRHIQFVVREPCRPRGGRYRFHRGLVAPGERFEILNKMTGGRLYVDGAEKVYSLAIGQVVSLSLSNEPLRLLGFRRG